MDSPKRCVLFFFLFGQLIAGVNREREHSAFVQNLLTNLKTNASSTKPEMSNGVFFPVSTNSNDFSTSINLHEDTSYGFSNLSTLGPLCSPFDSCNSRCGEVSRGFEYSCNCDSKCAIYSDCCVDFTRECFKEGAVEMQYNLINMTSNINLTCEMLFDSYPVLLVSTCSGSYENAVISKLCETKLPSQCFLSSVLSENENPCKSFVYALCTEQLNAKCNQTLEAGCAKIIKKECTKMSSEKCKMCDKSLWPVTDPNGVLYRNSYCALCNFQDNYTLPNFQSYVKEIQSEMWNSSSTPKENFRSCYPSTVDFCTGSDDLSVLCQSTSGPVTVKTKSEYDDVVYKNIYCALCNNEGIDDLQCASTWSNSSKVPNLMQGVIKPLIEDYVTGITADIQGLRLDDIPAAFSMLLNFGLDGRQRVYISSEDEKAMKEQQKECGSWKIWDPFSNICRKLHCSTEFVLVDYQCVRKEGHEEDYSMNDTGILVPDTEADFVHLSFVAEMELLDFLQFYKLDIEVICESIRESFSTSFNINIDRIRNVTFNISVGEFETLKEAINFINIMDEMQPINFTISLNLYESYVNRTESEPSIDSIVSLLASALSVNGFEFSINNTTSRIYEIHQTAEFQTSWCNPKDGGKKKEYWNSDFKLILNEDAMSNDSEKIKGIYINKTGKFYPKGEFVADILYQGYQFNQNLINVSGVAIVCDKNKLNDSCPRITLEKNEYSFAEDNSLIILNTSLRGITVDNKVYEESDNGSVLVCLTSEISMNLDEDYSINVQLVVQGYVTYVLSWFSVSSMIIVLITYLLFSSLRNLPGCNIMNLTFSLMAMQITFSLGQRNTGNACRIVARILHFEFLASFMWMNVMAYDLYQTFGNKTMLNNIRSTRKYLPRYMAYAYGIPLLFIVITSLLDHFLEDSIFSPHYGRNDVCWITSKHAAAAYFALPLAIVMCINICFFILTILSIRSVKHVLYLADEKFKHKGKSEVFLYARMALVIGLTWGLAFAAAYSKIDSLTGQILTYLFTIFNTLQGVFIFCVFVCNRRVYGLYREALQKILKKISKSSAACKTSGTFPRLANAMHRTISTDTVISTVSNSSTCSSDSGLRTIKEVEY